MKKLNGLILKISEILFFSDNRDLRNFNKLEKFENKMERKILRFNENIFEMNKDKILRMYRNKIITLTQMSILDTLISGNSYYFYLDVYEIASIVENNIFVSDAGHIQNDLDFLMKNKLIICKGERIKLYGINWDKFEKYYIHKLDTIGNE